MLLLSANSSLMSLPPKQTQSLSLWTHRRI
jgi:hypothetical protein